MQDYLQEKCPKCKSTDLDYKAAEFADTQIGYPFICNGCGVKLVEWYDLKFDCTTDMYGN